MKEESRMNGRAGSIRTGFAVAIYEMAQSRTRAIYDWNMNFTFE